MMVRRSTEAMVPAFLVILLILATTPACAGPRIDEFYEPANGLLRIGPEPHRAIHRTEKGFTLLRPGTGAARGVILLLDARRFVTENYEPTPESLEAEALSRGVSVLHITTGNPLDFLFDDAEVHDLVERIHGVLAEYDLAEVPKYTVGLSLAGTRSLRLTQYLEKTSGRHVPWRITAAAIVDSPLDMIRFWRAEELATERNFHAAAADEGLWVRYLLEKNLQGEPSDARAHYVRYSPFVFGEPEGGNARHLREVALRAYHEPDVDWWIEHRRKSYYSMNSIDQAALVNELRLAGNERAELVTTHEARDGFEEGSSPHTFSIVGTSDLVEWFLGQPPR